MGSIMGETCGDEHTFVSLKPCFFTLFNQWIPLAPLHFVVWIKVSLGNWEVKGKLDSLFKKKKKSKQKTMTDDDVNQLQLNFTS
jgi:hypothetical protein